MIHTPMRDRMKSRETSENAFSLKCLFYLALLSAAVLGAYSGVYKVPFIFDDKAWILQNPSIFRLMPEWPFRPRWFAELTLSLNFRLGGFNVFGYHVFNVIVHIAASSILFLLVKKTLEVSRIQTSALFYERRSEVALFSSLVWALHPLQTESVTYIIQRCESLMGVFYLLGIYCAAAASLSKRPFAGYSLTVLFYALGLACKEVMLTFPAVLFLYDSFFITGSFSGTVKRRWRLYLVLALVSLTVISSVRHVFFGQGESLSAGFGMRSVSAFEYLMMQPGVILHYIKMCFWPSPQTIHYYVKLPESGPLVAAQAAVLLSALSAGILLFRKRNGAGFLILVFFILLSPTSSFIPLQDAAAEHRLYLSLACYSAGITALLFFLSGKIRKKTTAVMFRAAVLSAYCLVLFLLTLQRNADYKDELTLWQSALEVQPGNPKVHNSLALEYMERGEVYKGIHHAEEALRRRPNFPSAHINLGICYESLGRLKEAEEKFNDALRLQPGNEDALTNLGNLHVRLKNYEQAEKYYKKALQNSPANTVTLSNLAGLHYLKGDYDSARAAYKKAIESNPYDAESWSNLGYVLIQAGNQAEGIKHIERALELDPDLAIAKNNLKRYRAS